LQRLLKLAHATVRSVVAFFREYPRLESHVAVFSLHSVQMYVGNVEQRDGSLSKGVCFELPRHGWPINRAAVMSQADAQRFVEFLGRLEARKLPCSFVFSREHEELKWKVARFQEEWHGGGGLVGYLHGNWLADHSNPRKVVITSDAVSALGACIQERYQIAT
jgi:hypothetical protein